MEGEKKIIDIEACDEPIEPMSTTVGRACAWCVINHIDIPIFCLSFLILYLSSSQCPYCVFIVALVSALTCTHFRMLNATLWSAILVLYLQKDCNIKLGNISIGYNRA